MLIGITVKPRKEIPRSIKLFACRRHRFLNQTRKPVFLPWVSEAFKYHHLLHFNFKARGQFCKRERGYSIIQNYATNHPNKSQDMAVVFSPCSYYAVVSGVSNKVR